MRMPVSGRERQEMLIPCLRVGGGQGDLAWFRDARRDQATDPAQGFDHFVVGICVGYAPPAWVPRLTPESL